MVRPLLVASMLTLAPAAFAKGPVHLTQTPADAGRTSIQGKIRFDKGQVTIEATRATGGKGRLFVWYPPTAEAAFGKAEWAGIVLKPVKGTNGRVFRRVINEGKYGLTNGPAYRSGVAFGELVEKPTSSSPGRAKWGEALGQNVTPEIAPDDAKRDFLKSMGLKPTF
jgi:hypothetical protein